MKYIVWIVAIIAVGGIVVLVFQGGEEVADGRYDAFAQCLAEKEITMYGLESCPHCQEEKRAFGSSFEFVPYVECSEEPQRCVEEGIRSVPAWVFPDGRKLVGKQGIEKLSEESDCPIEGL